MADLSELQHLDVDDVWRVLGRFGRYQLYQALVLVVAGLPMAFPVLSIVFQGDSGPFRCQIPDEHDAEIKFFENVTVVAEECRLLMRDNLTGVTHYQSCDEYSYDQPRYKSFVGEWDLVCEHAPLGQLSQTLVMAGMLVGAFFLSPLADKYGRKMPHVALHILLFAVSLAMAFMPNFAGLCVMKFFSGMFMMGNTIPWQICLLELFPTEERAIVGMGSSFVWALSIMIMTPVAYITRHYSWRTMQIVLAAFHAFSFLEIFLLDESLRWFVANRRYADIRRAVCKASRFNGRDPDYIISSTLEKAESARNRALASNIVTTTDSTILVTITEVSEDGTETPEEGQSEGCIENADTQGPAEKEKNDVGRGEGYVDLFKDPDMRFITLSVMYTWFTCSITYYGLTLLSSSLAGNKYVNFFLGGLLEIPSNVFMWFGFTRFGRKKTTMIFISIAWVSLLAASLVAALGGETAGAATVRTALSLAGRFGIAGAFNAAWIYTPEIYPTNLRNIGVGIGSTSARIGGMVAPFFKLVTEVAVWAPGTIFSALCLLVTLLMWLLPETMYRPLPQTIEDVKVWRQQDRKKKQQSI